MSPVHGVRVPALVATLSLALGAARCVVPLWLPDDPMLHQDHALEPGPTLIELLPGMPVMFAGADGELGSADDTVNPGLPGDVDLVLRSGLSDFSGPFPATAPLRGGAIPAAVAEPFGLGVPVAFVVAASDGLGTGAGAPTTSPSLAGVPVLVAAFADLDGDGFFGITARDGDPFDDEIEEAELEPVGRRFSLMSGSKASGELFVAAGGPSAAPLRVMLAAAAYTGDFDPAFFGGAVPQGPAVLTAFPFLPRTDPERVLDGNLPGPADPDSLIGVEIEDVFTPDPAALYREAFSVPADGSAASVDVADALSGALVRFGLARPPDPLTFQVKLSGALRPGVDGSGGRIVLEILESLDLSAGGAAVVRVVALDRLGNVADIGQPEVVTLQAHGRARIVSPDADGDLTRETLTLLTSAGLEVVLDAAGTPGGDDAIVVDGGGVPGRVDVQAP